MKYASQHKSNRKSWFSVFLIFNNFNLRWYCTIAEANKNQPLITINMVKMYPVEADTKVISIRQPYAVEYTTLTSKQVHASTGCYINKNFILYTIHRHKIHEQSIFSISFIFVFNSTIDSLYLIDWGRLFQSRHALNNTEFMP